MLIVDDHVRTEVKRLPGGQVSTKVSIGGRVTTTESSRLRKTPRRKNNRNEPKSESSFSDLMSHGTAKPNNSNKMSFSQMMGGLLQG